MSAPAELLILVSAVGQADTSYLPPLNDNPPNFHILPAAPDCRVVQQNKKRPQRAKYLGQRNQIMHPVKAGQVEGGGAQKYLEVDF